jgi:hypothetical protein
MAACYGHLDALKYAWNKIMICTLTAANGYLDVLIYAYENGCPWDKETCAATEDNEHTDALRWAREHGCPYQDG